MMRWISIGLLAMSCVVFSPTTFAQPNVRVPRPSATERGDWNGTWYYVNRDLKIALWLRTEDGKPQARFQILNTGTTEAFSTDWTGGTDYTFRRTGGRFHFDIKQADANRIQAHWRWLLGNDTMGRLDEGDVSVYRTADGRYMVFDFSGFHRRVYSLKRDESYPLDQVWKFRKASRREITWAEIPF